jgi:hypothetical protein
MHAYFQGHDSASHGFEIDLEAVWTGANVLFADSLPSPIENADMASSISQVNPDSKALY